MGRVSYTGSYAWEPTPDQRHDNRLAHFLASLHLPDLEALQHFATTTPAAFWEAAMDDVGITWDHRYASVMDTSRGLPWTTWWGGSTLNLATNAVERHRITRGDHAALIWEGDDGATQTLTYAEFGDAVDHAAGALVALGMCKGDSIGLFLPMIPETTILFLAAAKIGAIIVPLFSGYGAGAIVARLNNCNAKLLCCADGFLRRGSIVPMKSVADEVAAQVASIEHILVVKRLSGVTCDMNQGRDVWYDEITLTAPIVEFPVATSAEDPFMLIYTSGTTGTPKGTVHVHGGFPLKAAQDMVHCFDVGPEDRLLWFTDIGWMMGPWAICGTLIIGATMVMFEGTPDFPTPDRLWSVVERHHVSILGVAPTVIRSLMQHGDEPVHEHDLSSLRVLGSSGEPWNPEPWNWFKDVVGGGRCPIINYSGGTEVSGGIVAGNFLTPLNPCAFSGPCPGMDAAVFNDAGTSVFSEVGELVIRAPWPGMTRGFWQAPERYIDTYWSTYPNVWRHGDWAEIAKDGLWYIRGRSDDTIKIAGKRVGPAEVESILIKHPAVREGAAVGIPDPIKGEQLAIFVVLDPAVTTPESVIRTELIALVIAELGKALKPTIVAFVPDIPKTRNAKILRRLIRAAYTGSALGDVSSLENPASIEAIRSTATVH